MGVFAGFATFYESEVLKLWTKDATLDYKFPWHWFSDLPFAYNKGMEYRF